MRYATEVETWEAANVRTFTVAKGKGKDKDARETRYQYDLRRTVRRWITTVTTVQAAPNFRFKVLLANQAYSPAVNLRIDGAENAGAAGASFNDKVFRFQSASGLDPAALPTYRIEQISRLVFSMPLDAFNIQDWGTGTSRTGLHPISPTCAGISVARPTSGPLGEWRNGALTLQVIDPSVTSADVELNVAGRPELGYRLRPDKIRSKLIAEYLIYWHHPNNKCMGDDGWTRSPPQDTVSDAREGTPARGSDDPVGVFRPGSGVPPAAGAPGSTPVSGGTTGGIGSTPGEAMPSNPAPVVVTNADGSTTTTTVTYTALASGGYVETTTVTRAPANVQISIGIVTGGAVSETGIINTGGIDRNADTLGRINWRELKR